MAMIDTGRHGEARLLRGLAWGGAATLLALPAVAMRFTDAVTWSPADFAVFGAMLLAACAAFEFLLRRNGHVAYRLGVVVALSAAFLLVWIDLAVGIIGTETNPANAIFAGVLAVGIVAAILGRFTAAGMARALVATAAAQLVAGMAGGIAVGADGPLVGLTVLFTTLWLTAAALFRRAAG